MPTREQKACQRNKQNEQQIAKRKAKRLSRGVQGKVTKHQGSGIRPRIYRRTPVDLWSGGCRVKKVRKGQLGQLKAEGDAKKGTAQRKSGGSRFGTNLKYPGKQ